MRINEAKKARHSLEQITVSGLHTSLDEFESLPTLELNIGLNRKFVVENNWKAITDAWVNRNNKKGERRKGEIGWSNALGWFAWEKGERGGARPETRCLYTIALKLLIPQQLSFYHGRPDRGKP